MIENLKNDLISLDVQLIKDYKTSVDLKENEIGYAISGKFIKLYVNLDKFDYFYDFLKSKEYSIAYHTIKSNFYPESKIIIVMRKL